MLHFARWKQAVILGVCLLGVLLCLPNLMPRSAFPSWLEPRQISLGLDLRGGSYLLLEVDLNTVVRERLESAVDGVRGKLRTANIRYVNLAADAQNRRKVAIHLTRAGIALREKLLPEAQAVLEEAMAGMTEAERAMLLKLLRRARTSLASA